MSIKTLFHPMGGKSGLKKVVLNIITTTIGYNVATQLTALGLDVTKPYDIIINIANGITLGSNTTATYAFRTGMLAAKSTLTLNIGANAYITGYGGAGGAGSGYGGGNGAAGAIGGTAMYLQYPISINNLGTIQSGGRGGTGGRSNAVYDVHDTAYWMTGGQGGDGAGYTSGNGTISTGGGGRAGYYGCVDYYGSPRCTSGGAGSAGGLPGSNNSIVRNGNLITWINQGTIKGNIV